MRKIKLLIVDDHQIVREGLRVLLSVHPDIEVLGEAENGRQAVCFAQSLQPDIILMDVAMPLLNGREATAQIRKACPACKIIVLSSFSEVECVTQLMNAGAMGFVSKHSVSVELLTAIQKVYEGETFLCPGLSKRFRVERSARARAPIYSLADQLTPREAEVLRLVAEGFSNKMVASELGISIKTVEKHRHALMTKLNLHDTATLTRYAITRGMVVKTQLGRGTARHACAS